MPKAEKNLTKLVAPDAAPPANHQAVAASTAPPPRIRHTLAAWAAAQRMEVPEANHIQKTITRLDPRTRKHVTYKTARPSQYQVNRMIRYTHVWCILKAHAGKSGLIQQWNKQLPDLLTQIGCVRNSFITALRKLKELDWLYFDRGCIKLHSEAHVYKQCGLEYCKRIDRIFELPEKITDEKRTFYWIYLADVDDNRQRQAFVLHQKLTHNPELKLWWYGICQQRQKSITAMENDPMALAGMLQAEYLQNFHSRESEMFGWLVENRPDVNRGVKGMAAAWNTLAMNVCYIKKRFEQQMIAVVQRLGSIGSPGNSHNKHCRVMWNKVKRMTFQTFCDDITPRKLLPGQTAWRQEMKTAA